MEDTIYTIPNEPAGISPLHCQLFSEQHLDFEIKKGFTIHIEQSLHNHGDSKMLIIGGRTGAIAEMFIPYCSQIDIIQQDTYIDILKLRFLEKTAIRYRFNIQGFIGDEYIWKAPDLKQCRINVFSMEEFHKRDKVAHLTHYSGVLLQNILFNQNINIVRELMSVNHDVLITMLVPGKIVHSGLFQFLSGIEKNILMVFYDRLLHEKMKYQRSITGRRQQHLMWEIFVWKRKITGEQGSGKALKQILEILQEQISKNQIGIQLSRPQGTDLYETQELVNMYQVFHFGKQQHFGVANYPHVCAMKCITIAEASNIKGRALDLGCAVGRTSFDLAEYFDNVIGIDISKAFIQAANLNLKNLYPALASKVQFETGDACNIRKDIGKFNLIFGGNLIDRLYDPASFLQSVKDFLEPNGILVLSSPYTWLQEYTPKEKWIGGFENSQGHFVTTIQGLTKILENEGFKVLKHPQDILFVIQQNQWVYQYTKASMTFWQRN